MMSAHAPRSETDALTSATPVDALRRHALAQPGKTAIVFHASGDVDGPTERISFAQFDQRASRLAARWHAEGIAGERVLLLLPSGIDYLVAFFACARAGALPVPAYPPGSSTHAQRIARIAADAEARFVVADARLAAQRGNWRLGADDPLSLARWLTADDTPQDAVACAPHGLLPAPDAIAFLQYTSGSTGDPRGVQVTHGNLMHHARALRDRLALQPADVFVSWLPLFHDMGLIGMALQALMQGATLVLLPPAAFMQRPLRWLQAISHHRGSVSFAPNFAYDLCSDAAAAAAPQGLDLHGWRVAANAAEPVHAGTLQRFRQCFTAHRLSREAMIVGYGLAEATLMVSATVRATPMLAVDTRALEAGRLQRALPATPAAPAPRSRLVASTGAADGALIVDPETLQPLPEGQVGEIWVATPAVASGYWQRPQDTERTFQAHLADGRGPFLRTGDLGGLLEGALYVVGRLKDLIIVRGQNHHPGDIEHSALAAHRALARAAAFATEHERHEAVVLVAELRRSDRRRFHGAAIVTALRAALAEAHALDLHAVLLLPPGALPLTSSGKVQRQACRRQFDQGRFDPLFSWRAAPAADGTEARSAQEAKTISPLDVGALMSLSVEDRRRALSDLLFDLLAQALKFDDARRSALRPDFEAQQLSMLGLESLAAVELSHAAQARLGLELPVPELLGGATAGEVVIYLQDQLMLRQLTAAPPPGADTAEPADVWVL